MDPDVSAPAAVHSRAAAFSRYKAQCLRSDGAATPGSTQSGPSRAAGRVNASDLLGPVDPLCDSNLKAVSSGRDFLKLYNRHK